MYDGGGGEARTWFRGLLKPVLWYRNCSRRGVGERDSAILETSCGKEWGGAGDVLHGCVALEKKPNERSTKTDIIEGERMAVTNQISVLDLHNRMRQRQQRQLECYRTMLDRAYARIRRCASVNMFGCEFEVPEVAVGLPLFDADRCIQYMIRSLIVNGYHVRRVASRTLQISWEMQDDDRPPSLPPPALMSPALMSPHALSLPASDSQGGEGLGQGHQLLQGQGITRLIVQQPANPSTRSMRSMRSITEFRPSSRFTLPA